MKKVILFDLNNVLVTYKLSEQDEKYLELFGVSRGKFWKTQKHLNRKHNLGNFSEEEYLRKKLKGLELDEEHWKVVAKLWRKDFKEVPGIRTIIEKLKTRGHKLILVAGDSRDALKWKIDDYNFRKYFDAIYLTANHGFLKEDVEMYKLVLEKENLKAEDCLFTDDILKHKKAAESIGIETHLFTTAEKFRGFLEEKKIL